MSSLHVALRSNGFPLWSFTITLTGHTILGKTPLDDWSTPDEDTWTCKHTKSQETSIRARGAIRTQNPSLRTAFSWRCRGSTRTLAALDSIAVYDFRKMFPAVEAALGSLHPIAGGVFWRGRKFQNCTNILNNFLTLREFFGLLSYRGKFIVLNICINVNHIIFSPRCKYSHNTFGFQPWRRPAKGQYTMKWTPVRSADGNILCSLSFLRGAPVFISSATEQTILRRRWEIQWYCIQALVS